MATIHAFEDLEVWKKARTLSQIIYSLTRNRIFHQDHSLKNQMRRCSVSVMANIAEGLSRQSDKEFVRFLFIAKGSCAELRSHSYVALDQEYLSHPDFEKIQTETDAVSRMLSNLLKYLRSNQSR